MVDDELHRQAERRPGGTTLLPRKRAGSSSPDRRQRSPARRSHAASRLQDGERSDLDRGRTRPDHVRATAAPSPAGGWQGSAHAASTSGRSRCAKPPGAGRVQMDAVGVEPVLPLPGRVPVGNHDLRPPCRLGADRRVDRAVVLAHLVQRRPDDVLDTLGGERLEQRLHVVLVLVDVVVVADVDDHDRAERAVRSSVDDVEHGRRADALVRAAELDEPPADPELPVHVEALAEVLLGVRDVVEHLGRRVPEDRDPGRGRGRGQRGRRPDAPLAISSGTTTRRQNVPANERPTRRPW